MTESDTQASQHPLDGRSPVLVLGATSLIGRFLVDRLVEAGIETIAISRHVQPPQKGVTWLIGDLTDLHLPPTLSAPLAISTSPIWLLAPALAALRRAGVVRLVAFSSTSRFTKARSPIQTERDVARRLLEGENATQSYCEQVGVAWTILRPTVIYAEGYDRSITRLANLIRRVHVLPLAGSALGRRQPVHADDLAAGAIAAAISPATRNRAYELPGGETITYRSMVERIFEGIGRQPRILSIPPALWRFGLRFASYWMPNLTTEMGSRMADNLVFDATPAQRDFGWRPRRFRPVFPSKNSSGARS